MNPFATNSQMLDRYDARWLGKNLLDDGTAASAATLANAYTVAGGRLQTLLTDASEELMAAAAAGARYTEDDLRTYGGNLVVAIVCGLTLGLVVKRRGRALTDSKELSAAYDVAAEQVEQLRRGERIFFAVPDVPEAGLPESADMAPGPLAPASWASQASRYFGFPAGSDCPPPSGGCGYC